MNDTVNIMRIIRGTTVDGPGFRTSIYFAGCHHKCKDCHNPESWDFNAGNPMMFDEIKQIIEEEDFDVTLSGGDPLYHTEWVIALSDFVHSLGHTLWLYTGFTWEEITDNRALFEAVRNCDVIVDSPFDYRLRNTDLLFKGSSNQRIIDVGKSIEHEKIILWRRI